MNRVLVRTARRIYKATPSSAVRQFFFNAFCRLMRHRQTRATINGSTFDLDLSETIDIALYLEQYEPDVAAALERYCAAGMIVLDIGANIGAHTLALGRLVTRSGAVYAFEPTDFAYPKLLHNVSLNAAPHVRVVKAALSDHTAPCQPVRFRASWQTAGGRRDGESRVDFVRLDDWCADNGVHAVGLIKIDVDGHEFAVFSGGRSLLERCRPVIVMEAAWLHFADPARNPIVLLEELRYRFTNARTGRRYADASEIAREFPDPDPEMTTSINIVATPSP